MDLVLYDCNNLDSIAAAWAAFMALKKYEVKVFYTPWDDTDLMPNFNKVDTLYILGLSFNSKEIKDSAKKTKEIILMDYKKEMEVEKDDYWKNPDNNVKVNLHDGINGSICVLAWEFFHGKEPVPKLLEIIEDQKRPLSKYRATAAIMAALDNKMPIGIDAFDDIYNDFSLEHLESIGDVILDQIQLIVHKLKAQKHSMRFGDEVGMMVNASEQFSFQIASELAQESNFGGTYEYCAQTDTWLFRICSQGNSDVEAIAKLYGGKGNKYSAMFGLTTKQLETVMSGKEIIIPHLVDNECAQCGESFYGDYSESICVNCLITGVSETPDKLFELTQRTISELNQVTAFAEEMDKKHGKLMDENDDLLLEIDDLQLANNILVMGLVEENGQALAESALDALMTMDKIILDGILDLCHPDKHGHSSESQFASHILTELIEAKNGKDTMH